MRRLFSLVAVLAASASMAHAAPLRTYFSTDPNAHSGLRGWHIDRPSADHIPHGIKAGGMAIVASPSAAATTAFGTALGRTYPQTRKPAAAFGAKPVARAVVSGSGSDGGALATLTAGLA